MYKNIIPFFIICSFSFNLWANFRTCSENQNKTQYSVYLGMEKKNLDDVGVFGADVDKRQSEGISKIMFGTKEIHSIMPTISNASEGSVKKYIIAQLLDQKKKAGPEASVNFFYSGHGYRCRDLKTQMEHWCLGVGEKSYSEKFPNDKRTVDETFEIISSSGVKTYLSKNDVITEEELMESLGPQNMILDSCRSGLASDILLNRKDQIAGHSGVFVMASSLSDQVSTGDSQKGGTFYNTLLRMLKNNQKKLACMMDWEGNGVVSDRALSIGLMLAFTPSEFKIPTSKEAKSFSHHEQLKNGISSAIEKHEYQLTVSNPNGSCLLKHDFQCPPRERSTFVPKNKCDHVLLEHRKMTLAIDEMIKNRSLFRDVLDKDIKNDPRSFQRSFQAKGKGELKVINPNQGKMVTDQFGTDMAIMLFLEKFKYDLEEESQVSCPMEIDAKGCYHNEVRIYNGDLDKMFEGIDKIFNWGSKRPKHTKARGGKGK